MKDNEENIKMSMLYMAKSDASFMNLCGKLIDVGGKLVLHTKRLRKIIFIGVFQ